MIFICIVYSSLEDTNCKYYCDTFPLLWEYGGVLLPSAGTDMVQVILLCPPSALKHYELCQIVLSGVGKNKEYEGWFDFMLKK